LVDQFAEDETFKTIFSSSFIHLYVIVYVCREGQQAVHLAAEGQGHQAHHCGGEGQAPRRQVETATQLSSMLH